MGTERRTIIEGMDYVVRLVPMPSLKVDGMVSEDENGFFSIYINSNQTEEKKKKALIHEFRHILNDDFHRQVPIQQLELEASV